jgi:hypothetical protein
VYISFRNFLFNPDAEDGKTPVDSLQRAYGSLDNERDIEFPKGYQSKILSLALSDFDISQSADWKKREKAIKDAKERQNELELGLKRKMWSEFQSIISSVRNVLNETWENLRTTNNSKISVLRSGLGWKDAFNEFLGTLWDKEQERKHERRVSDYKKKETMKEGEDKEHWGGKWKYADGPEKWEDVVLTVFIAQSNNKKKTYEFGEWYPSEWYVFIAIGLPAGEKCHVELRIKKSILPIALENVATSAHEWKEVLQEQRTQTKGRAQRRAMVSKSSSSKITEDEDCGPEHNISSYLQKNSQSSEFFGSMISTRFRNAAAKDLVENLTNCINDESDDEERAKLRKELKAARKRQRELTQKVLDGPTTIEEFVSSKAKKGKKSSTAHESLSTPISDITSCALSSSINTTSSSKDYNILSFSSGSNSSETRRGDNCCECSFFLELGNYDNGHPISTHSHYCKGACGKPICGFCGTPFDENEMNRICSNCKQ